MMRIMRTIIQAFLVTLGLTFLLLLMVLGYVWFNDVWKVQTLAKVWLSTSDSEMMHMTVSTSTGVTEVGSSTAATNTTQARMMNEAGIDRSFFTSLGDSAVQCFRNRLGSARVDEIIDGAMPTTAEIITGLPCVE